MVTCETCGAQAENNRDLGIQRVSYLSGTRLYRQDICQECQYEVRHEIAAYKAEAVRRSGDMDIYIS